MKRDKRNDSLSILITQCSHPFSTVNYLSNNVSKNFDLSNSKFKIQRVVFELFNFVNTY